MSREIGTWWHGYYEDPREELLCLQWLRSRIRGYGRTPDSKRLFFIPLGSVHHVFLPEAPS